MVEAGLLMSWKSFPTHERQRRLRALRGAAGLADGTCALVLRGLLGRGMFGRGLKHLVADQSGYPAIVKIAQPEERCLAL
jgi:hypothetical protein